MRRDKLPGLKEQLTAALSGIAMLVLTALMCAVLGLLTSCTSQRVVKEVPVVLHDTILQKILQVDTLVETRRDTSWSNRYTIGDTIYIETGKIEYVGVKEVKYLHDTISKAVYIPYETTEYVEVKVPEVKYVEKKLSKWQKFLIGAGYTLLVSTLLLLLYIIYARMKPKGWIAKLINLLHKNR